MSSESVFPLPRGWVVVPLAAACESGGGGIQTGPFGSQLHKSDYVATGIPSIMPVNIGDNRVDPSDIAMISDADAKRLSRYLVQPGDILYSRRGDVRRRALVREAESGWLCGTGCLRVRPGGGVLDSRYLSYYLGHPMVQDWIERHAVGATMPNLNTGILGSLPVAIPPLGEQRAIADILGALDDKIELNRKMSETLDELAFAVFKRYFADVEALPAGWAEQPLDSLGEFRNGVAMQKYPPVQGLPTLPVIKIAQLRAGNTNGADLGSADLDQAYLVRDGDLLFSWSGSLEAVWWTGGNGALNQHLFKVTSKTHPLWFVYFWIHHHLPGFRHIAAGKATTMGHINRGHLTQATVLVPPAAVIADVGRVVEPLVERSILARLQCRTLASLRDSLLPRLLSGELRVSDAEKIAEEVV